MSLSAAELGYLRDDHPHISTIQMSVFKASVVYVGTVTGSPSRGARTVTVSDVSGTISNITEGQTILVGTSSGDDDVSRRRFRSRSGQNLTVDENSVVWANGQFITVIDFYEVWPVFPYIEPTDPYTFYKDRDVAYSDQNLYPDPVAVAGDHQAGYLDGVSVAFTLDGSDSYAIAQGATISSYLWECSAGTIASPSSATTTITFTSTQEDGVWVKLTVTDSNGKSHTTRRAYFVHTRTGSASPNRDFTISQTLSGSWRVGGWKVGIESHDNALITDIQDKTLVVLWQEASYNGTVRDIDSKGNVVFAGYITGETIQKDISKGYVQFEAHTPEDLLKNRVTFSVSLVDTSSPSKWYEMANLTVTRAIHHMWHWHSTIMDVTDVIIENSSIRLVACDDFVQGDLYKSVDTFARQHGIFAHACCSKSGKLYVEIDIQMLNDASRAAKDTVMEITAEDRRDLDDFSIYRNKTLGAAFAMLSGTVYDGSTKTPIIAKAPGEVPHTEGTGELSLTRQALASQTDANERVGRALAISNALLTDGSVKFAGNYSFIDIVPQAWYTITLTASETKRGLTLTDKKLVPRDVAFQIEMGQGVILQDVRFDPEATGDDGIAGQFPTETPDTYPDPDAPTTIYDEASGRLFSFSNQNGCYVYTSWSARNGALSGANIQDQYAGLDPWWFTSSKAATTNPANVILWKCDVGKIYRSTDAGVTWSNMTPASNPPNSAVDSPAPTVADLTFMWHSATYPRNQEHVFLARYDAGAEWRSWLLLTQDDGSTWTWTAVEE